jgi:hypothetical protein
MSVPVTHLDRDRVPRETHPGQKWGIASLLMVPAIIVLYIPLFFIGYGLQSALGLAEDEMLTEAGLWGVAAAVLMLGLTASPQVVGIVLGVKARRLGAFGLGTAGVVANGVVGAFLLLGSVLQLLFA